MNHYLEKLAERIGNPKLIFCLDSATLDYDRLWLTNSLRGNLVATVQVKTLTEGVHSGDASGVTPSCFRIMSQLINRLEDAQTGQVNKKFHVHIPANRYEECERLVEVLGDKVTGSYPFYKNTKPLNNNTMASTLRRTWEPTLTITGQNGLPDVSSAGNVMLPEMEIRFSLRMPPTLNHEDAVRNLTEIIESDPPYGAHVEVKNVRAAKGWNAKKFDKAIEDSIN